MWRRSAGRTLLSALFLSALLTVDVGIGSSPAEAARSEAATPFQGPALAQVSTGTFHSCGLTSVGTAYCWGSANANGQIGDGTTETRYTPTPVTMPAGVRFTTIDVGWYHTCALTDTGLAYCWGWNNYGQGGDGTTDQHLSPTLVSMPASTTFTDISAGDNHTCAVTSVGTIYCWGFNSNGQIGDQTSGVAQSRYSPTATWMPASTKFVSVVAGLRRTCALTSAGAAYCWGQNTYGELGVGNTDDQTKPTAVDVSGDAAGRRFTSVSILFNHACALASDGTAWCWGRGNSGQLGNASSSNSSLPVAVSMGGKRFRSIDVGALHSCAVGDDGAVWCWGLGTSYELGNNSTSSVNTPTATTMPASVTFTSVSTGNAFSCGQAMDFGIWCWGNNSDGRVGTGVAQIGTNVAIPTAITVPSAAAFAVIGVGQSSKTSCALGGDGTLSCWGYNGDGQVGDGSRTNRTLPTDITIAGSRKLAQVAAGFQHSCGVATDGTAWCWGSNPSGQLGNNSTTDSTTPTAVTMPAGKGFVQIAVGEGHTCALASDGTAWCWGYNGAGNLGDGTTTGRLVPTAVTMPAGTTFTRIVAGTYWNCALASDGATWCWGTNGNGQFGNDFAGSSSSIPVATTMPANTSFVEIAAGIAHMCAVAGDGGIWCWGYNDSGQIGDASTTDRGLPTELTLPAGKRFVGITAGHYHSCAIASDGGAWCWGANTAGQLGDGTTTARLTMTAVASSAPRFVQLAGGTAHTCAISSAGTAWCWGYGLYGQLGLGGTQNVLSPTSLTSVTVTRTGSGSGTVTSVPAGIDCGSTCSASFTRGEIVTLSASAPSGSAFSGWSGEGCSGTGDCVVTASRTRSVTATFVTVFAPDQPTSVAWASAGGGGGVSLSWVAPSDGNATITSYDVRYSTSSTMTSPTVVTSATTGSPAGTSYTRTGLTNGTIYYVQVRAVNSVNPSAWGPTTPVAVIPGTPAAISSLTATPGSAQVALSWSAPANNGAAVSGYDVRFSTSSAMTTPTTATTTTTSLTRTGLVNGTTYYFQVRAKNTRGAGPWGPATPTSATPFTVPGQPTSLSWDPGATSVTLSWVAPASNGSTITDYNVRYSTSSTMSSPVTVTSATSGNPAGTSATISNGGATPLVTGTTYYVQVQAKNSAGVGTWGPATPVAVIVGAPALPTSLDAVRGSTSVALSWSAPSDNGSAITGYDMRRSTTAAMASPTTVTLGVVTSYTATGLTNGTTYYFQIRAKSVRGSGPWGPATPASATPATVPGTQSAPTVLRDGFGSLKVSATVVSTVAATGGSPILSYTFTSVQDATKTCTATLPATSCSVSGLTTGTSYTFTAKATNDVGTSANPSVQSTAIVPVGRTAFSTNASALTSSTQLNLTPNSGAAVPVGARLLIYYAADTASASTPVVSSVTFPGGGAATCTLTYGGFAPASGATAGSGIRAGIVYCNVTTQIPANALVRLTLSAAPASAIAIGEYLIGFASGGAVTATTVTRGVASAPTITGSSVAAGRLVIGAFAYEDNTLVDADTDSAGGSTWSSAINLQNSGSGLTALTVFRQLKWVSVAAAPTYNTATATPASADWLAGLLSIG